MNSEIQFLCVEDSDIDHESIERSFKKLKISNKMHRARDGEEALEILRGTSPNEALRRPYVVLLDLNMPRMGGLEFLSVIRKDPNLKKTPVFVLTTSEHRKDIEAAHEHNVCGYIAKPIKRGEMMLAVEALKLFWTLCVFPQVDPSTKSA